MDPKFLTQLAIIVELGSVTKAARKLNVTQPTLSRSVKVIEDRIGGKVLRRERYGVAPTEIGLRLADDGRAILRRSEQAQIAIQEWKHGLDGELRIGVGPMLAATIMGDFFAETVGNPPGYSLKLNCEVAARLMESLNDGELDLAIMPYDLTPREDRLVREKLFSDRLSVFVGENDPLARASNVPASALSLHKWIAVGEVSGLFDITRQTLDGLGLPEVTPLIENTGDVTMTFRMLEKTMACSMLPRRILSGYHERFNICPIDLGVQLPTRNVGLWMTMAGRDRPEIMDFLDRLSAFLGRKGLD